MPLPAADARTHSARLRDLIRQRVLDAGGWLSFSEYMDMALYAPGLGYYSAGARKFGDAGDFITAPELGDLFAQVLARVCVNALDALGADVIVEVGAGTGALAAGLLAASGEKQPARYLIIEVSADLRERQRETLAARVPGSLHRVEWLDQLPAQPVSGVLLANEVLDALPVERFLIREGEVLALGVVESADGPGFAWSAAEASPLLREAVEAVQSEVGYRFPSGYRSELNLRLNAWIAGVCGAVRPGLALFIDYGGTRREYYHPQRSQGTLACHYRHRFHDDPFFMPGLQDISAWVDFSAVAHGGVAAGWRLTGYGTQSHFLAAAGLPEVLSARPGALPDSRLVMEARRLLMPGDMGEKFKVMLLSAGHAHVGTGLLTRDLRHLL